MRGPVNCVRLGGARERIGPVAPSPLATCVAVRLVAEKNDARLCSVAAEIEKLQRRMCGTVRRCGCDDVDALAIYVHALSTEDVIVQVLLRDRPPLMLRYAPKHNGATSWRTDPETLRRYASATHTATRTFLRRLQHQGPMARPRLSLPPLDPRRIAFVLQHLLVPSLERAAADIESLSSPCPQRSGGH
jgi:hypothetical protein